MKVTNCSAPFCHPMFQGFMVVSPSYRFPPVPIPRIPLVDSPSAAPDWPVPRTLRGGGSCSCSRSWTRDLWITGQRLYRLGQLDTRHIWGYTSVISNVGAVTAPPLRPPPLLPNRCTPPVVLEWLAGGLVRGLAGPSVGLYIRMSLCLMLYPPAEWCTSDRRRWFYPRNAAIPCAEKDFYNV